VNGWFGVFTEAMLMEKYSDDFVMELIMILIICFARNLIFKNYQMVNPSIEL